MKTYNGDMNEKAAKNNQLIKFCKKNDINMRVSIEKNIRFLRIIKYIRPSKKYFWSKFPDKVEVEIGSIRGLGGINLKTKVESFTYVIFYRDILCKFGIPIYPNGYFKSKNPYYEIFNNFCKTYSLIMNVELKNEH